MNTSKRILSNVYEHMYFMANDFSGDFYEDGYIKEKVVLPRRKQKQFRALIKDMKKDNGEYLTSDILAKISDEVATDAVIDFLHQNYLDIKFDKEEKDKKNKKILEGFSSEIVDIMINISQYWFCFSPVNEKREIEFTIDSSIGSKKRLILKNISTSSPLNFLNDFDEINIFELDEFEYEKENENYILKLFHQGNNVEIRFDNIEIDNQFFNYFSAVVYGETLSEIFLWNMILDMLNEIRMLKLNYGYDRLNDIEKRLFPLSKLEEIIWRYNVEEKDQYLNCMDSFYLYAQEFNAVRLVPILEELKSCNTKRKSKRLIRKLNIALRDKSSESLWKHIYNELEKAASIYPLKNQICIEKLEKEREEVKKVFLSQEFVGEYPHFRKIGVLKGVKTLKNSVNVYFVGNEKNMASYVYCKEFIAHDGEIIINFFCGTIFLKPKEVDNFEKMDAFSAFFLDKGRRYNMVYQKNPWVYKDETKGISNEDIALIASKKATISKLIKEEKKKLKLLYSNSNRYVTLFNFLLYVVFGSFLFGLGMMLSFMGIEIVLVLVSTRSMETVIESFKIIPWYWIFLGTGLPWGIIMGLITFLSDRYSNRY